jgi:hypothetical protein
MKLGMVMICVEKRVVHRSDRALQVNQVTPCCDTQVFELQATNQLIIHNSVSAPRTAVNTSLGEGASDETPSVKLQVALRWRRVGSGDLARWACSLALC